MTTPTRCRTLIAAAATVSVALAAAPALVVLVGCTGVSTGERHGQAQPTPQGEEAHAGWSVPFDGNTSGPVLSGRTLYVGAGDGALYAIDPRNGSTRWRFATGAGLVSGPQVLPAPRGTGDRTASAEPRRTLGRREITVTPVVHEGTVYVGSRDHTFYAIDALSGHQKWSFPTGGEIIDEALIQAGVVVVVSHDRMLYGLDSQTGEKRWAADTVPAGAGGTRAPTLPTIHDGTVYVTNWPVPGRGRSFVHALDLASGRARWMLQVAGGFPSPPVHAEGVIVFSTEVHAEPRGTLIVHGVDATSGAAKWRHELEATPNEILSRPPTQADGGSIAVTGHVVAALDNQTGAVRWLHRPDQDGDRFDVALGHGSMVLVVARSRELVSTGRGRAELLALDARTGAQKWSARLGSGFPGVEGAIKLAATNGDSVFVVAGRFLQRLELATGRQMWAHWSDTWIHASPFVGEASVYVASAQVRHAGQATDVGRLQALDLRSGRVRP